LHSPLEVSSLFEANAKNLHQTGRAFIMCGIAPGS
jgi:hypothetical protein